MLLDRIIWETDSFVFGTYIYDKENIPEDWKYSFEYSKEGNEYKLLLDKNLKDAIIMSDTEYEWIANKPLIDAARGDVLIIGLGINFITPYVIKASDSVTVLELNQDIIDNTPTEANVVKGDVFNVNNIFEDSSFDVVLEDLWIQQSTHILKDSLERLLRPGGELVSWNKI